MGHHQHFVLRVSSQLLLQLGRQLLSQLFLQLLHTIVDAFISFNVGVPLVHLHEDRVHMIHVLRPWPTVAPFQYMLPLGLILYDFDKPQVRMLFELVQVRRVELDLGVLQLHLIKESQELLPRERQVVTVVSNLLGEREEVECDSLRELRMRFQDVHCRLDRAPVRAD